MKNIKDSKISTISIGISLKENLLGKIDEKRGDISRSRFIQRIIEDYLKGG